MAAGRRVDFSEGRGCAAFMFSLLFIPLLLVFAGSLYRCVRIEMLTDSTIGVVTRNQENRHHDAAANIIWRYQPVIEYAHPDGDRYEILRAEQSRPAPLGQRHRVLYELDYPESSVLSWDMWVQPVAFGVITLVTGWLMVGFVWVPKRQRRPR